MYDELVKRLRSEAVYLPEKFSKNAELLDVLMKAADAIEELQKRVPKRPHGRLIDEQWLKDAMITTLEALKKNPKMDRQEMHLIAAFDTLRCMVEDAPTIIPAEEDTDFFTKGHLHLGYAEEGE